MHELSIAMSIVDLALEEARNRSVTVDAIHLDIGPLSGVVADALRFSWEIACQDTPLEGSRLVIREVPVEIHCSTCNADRTLDSMQWLCCPVCGTPALEVIHGKELAVTALEVRDEQPAAAPRST
ncbi:MAG TPA: hydrogenase maturation nickel metallochaperone HypA [Silvibacterium sp.]|nr:hydrogenase maturation nickel metallochaperone HypA [Silvibacterium sp.]